MADIVQQYYEKFLDSMLTSSRTIKISSSFHGQMRQINALLSNDTTALISTVLEFMTHSANVNYSFDAQNVNLNKVLLDWSNNLNKDLNLDIPKGLRNFQEQFIRERLKSSLSVVRLRWSNVNGYYLPTKMWLMDGSSIYVQNEKKNLNTNKYYFGKPNSTKSNILQNTETETILIRKPYTQWYDQYPTPYLVKTGALYYALFKQQLLARIAEVVNTAFPYQFFIKMGTENAINSGKGPGDVDLQKQLDFFKKMKTDYSTHAGAKGLAGAFPADVKFEELIPSYNKVLDEKLFGPIDKNILSSLGMIELKGFSQNREEMILNPKVLVEEVNDIVLDSVDFLEDVMDLIKEKNSKKYTFNDSIEVSPGIIESFMTDNMRNFVRSWYDRGLVSMEDGLEDTTSLNFKTQVKKRKSELKDNLNVICYPRVTQNLEKDPADLSPEDVTPDKKKGTPESKNYKNALDDNDYITESLKSNESIPSEIRNKLTDENQDIFRYAFNEALVIGKKLDYDDYLLEKTAMEFAVKKTFEYIEAPYTKTNYPSQIKHLPVGARNIWINTFNKLFEETKDENKARQIAWRNVKLKYKKINDKWIKK